MIVFNVKKCFIGMIYGWFLFNGVFLAGPVLADSVPISPDYTREQRWANEVIPGLIIGEPVYLTQKNSHKFLGLYAQADDATMGVVVVHGMGLHPDWGIISPLRQQLFDLGYSTFSIQMPVLSADASYKDYPGVFPEAAKRLQLAVAWLRQTGVRRICIVSHSNGSRMSRVFMVNKPADVSAWVAISLTQGDTFAGVKVPVLDVYGENDLPHVLSSTVKRKNSFIVTSASKQIVIPNADHFFNGHEQSLVTIVKDYLDYINQL